MREKRKRLELMTDLEEKIKEMAGETNKKLIELATDEKGKYSEDIHQLSILLFIRYLNETAITWQRLKILKESSEEK